MEDKQSGGCWPEGNAVAEFFSSNGLDWSQGGRELAEKCSCARIQLQEEVKAALGIMSQPFLDELAGMVRDIVTERNALRAEVERMREILGWIGRLAIKHVPTGATFYAEWCGRVTIDGLLQTILAESNPQAGEDSPK